MPAALKTLIDNGKTDANTAMSNLLNARNKILSAGGYIGSQDWPQAQTAMTDASNYFGYFAKYLLQDDVFYKGFSRDWRDALYWINDNWPTGAAEITMDDILSAMVTATDSQLMNFIGLVDAFRQSLWNKSFNAEYFAALARGFT